jgi:hypothetical protein
MPALIFGLTFAFRFGEPLVLSDVDWAWSISCLVSGALLLVRLKSIWIFSMIQIFCVALLNLYQFFSMTSDEFSIQYSLQFLFSVASLSGILLMAKRFKYPYLDRRDTILYGIAYRYKVHFQSFVNDHVPATTLSASISGFMLELSNPLDLSSEKSTFITIPELGIEHAEVFIIENTERKLRVRLKKIGLSRYFEIQRKLRGFPTED